MKNTLNVTFKTALVLLAAFFCHHTADAQQGVPALKTGDSFLKISTVNSVSVLQRGDVSINVNSASSVSKTYKIDEVNDNGYSVTMTTKSIKDSIYSGDNRFHFDSDKPVPTTDQLANALQFAVGKPTTFNVYQNGIIGEVDANAAVLANDTLFNFTGIEQDALVVGERFSLIADLTSYDKLKVGDNWADTSAAEGDKTITKFWVVARTPTATTLGYTSSTRGDKLNTNSNGTYVVNNATGLITQRIVQTVTVGYQIYKRAIYSSTRRTNITENCYAMR